MAGTFLLIAAAGRGTRTGGSLPKQYVLLAGKTVLARTIAAFIDHPRVDGICVVIHADDLEQYEAATSEFSDKLLLPAIGGATRQQSVINGLEALAPYEPEHVLIHDAARPFVDAALIARICSAIDEHPCVLPVVPIADTVKKVAEGKVKATLDRANLFGAQTPQAFSFQLIRSLHEQAEREAQTMFTDDASIAEWAGTPVHVVAGSAENRKLTTRLDMMMAELELNAMEAPAEEIRTGSGYDVHAFETGDRVILCGVAIPFDRKLKGHSDADVAMHALTDAILGAIGSEDIGFHFPPSDTRWKGAPSEVFLRHAVTLTQQKNARLVNVDVTMICELPKIGPHREAMRANLAQILGIGIDRVSVKATTTEGLGFTGRQEGIAASAVANVAYKRRMDGLA